MARICIFFILSCLLFAIRDLTPFALLNSVKIQDATPLFFHLALHLVDNGLPSRHLVMPSMQSTPLCREQQPLQSADTVAVSREIDNSMDRKRVSFFISYVSPVRPT